MATLKISDLSVGDWVRCRGRNGRIERLETIRYDERIRVASESYLGTMYQFVGIEDIEPIPITAEILDKNGFTLCEDCTSRWKKEFSSFCVFVTAPEGYASVTVYKRVAHGHRRVIDDLQLNGVHQLQHALRLAGVEKEIVV